MHYYKFNIAAWTLSTAHLSLEEEAVYFRLINHYYDTETPIPLETQSVCRRLRLGSEVVASEILNEFFVKTDNGFVHIKCDQLLKEYRKTAYKNKKNGAKGGRPKADAASKITQSVTSGLPEETQAEPKHNPNYELLTKNYKLETNNQELINNKEIKPKAKRFVPPSIDDVRKYCNERNNSIDPETFVAHYTSNGWKRGNTSIKDWKSCVITWEKKQSTSTPRSYGRPQVSQQGFLSDDGNVEYIDGEVDRG